jgi:hypothetical protein
MQRTDYKWNDNTNPGSGTDTCRFCNAATRDHPIGPCPEMTLEEARELRVPVRWPRGRQMR